MEQSEKKNNKVIMVGILLIALVFVFTFFKSSFVKKTSQTQSAPKAAAVYPSITATDLKAKLKNPESLQILDIRGSEDYKLEHLINSINVVSEDSLSGIAADKTAVVVEYVGSSQDYSSIINALKNKGIKNIFVLDGGIDGWKGSGGSTISIGNPSSFLDNSKIVYFNPEDLKNTMDSNNYPIYILDARSIQEFSSGHIKGAENIFLDDLEKSTNNLPSGKMIYVYGNTELQGFQAGVRLYDLGFLKFKVLKGGIKAWTDKGFELVK